MAPRPPTRREGSPLGTIMILAELENQNHKLRNDKALADPRGL